MHRTRVYVVQTNERVVERCILMTTDPGDLVLDPTCGSGTTAYVAEQWGRRWITIDTSRVALALARARIMGARYPYYLLADSREGQRKEAEVTRARRRDTPTHSDIRQGFVYRAGAAHHAEVDRQQCRDRRDLGEVAGDAGAAARRRSTPRSSKTWEEWEIPRELPTPTGRPRPRSRMPNGGRRASPGRRRSTPRSPPRPSVEYLYDKPYTDNARVRVAGPFTVESLSPHRVLPVDERRTDRRARRRRGQSPTADAAWPDTISRTMVLDYLQHRRRAAGSTRRTASPSRA